MKAWVSLAVVLSCALLFGAPSKPEPKNLVPDSETAIAIAKAVLKPIYGADFVKRHVFTAEQCGHHWVVIGKVRLRRDQIATGGKLELHINAEDVTVTYIHLQL